MKRSTKYAEYEVSISIGDGEILAGDLPRKQLRLVQAWISYPSQSSAVPV